jgi:hypothetical protein
MKYPPEGSSFLIMAGIVAFEITSNTILQILEENDLNSKEVTSASIDSNIKSIEKGLPSVKIDDIRKGASPVIIRAINNKKEFRITEIRKLLCIKYGAGVALVICSTIVIPLSYSSISLRSPLSGIALMLLAVGVCAICYYTYSVFKYYGMLLRLLNEALSSEVQGHLSSSMR